MAPSIDLFTSVRVGDLSLPNRLVMPALTRSRAGAGDVATRMSALYYAQRASAGLMICEGSPISPNAVGYIATPGVFSAEQIEAWRVVTDAVHANGGRIFHQLWHVGRMSHPDLLPAGLKPLAPSAILAKAQVYTPSGFKDVEMPQELTLDGIAAVVEEFRQGAKNAKSAGFDGVEIHAANGYLPDQFLRDKSNTRTDAYGGSFANRCRFLLEITDAAIEVWGAGRVGVRIAPENQLFDVSDRDPQALFGHLVQALGQRGIAYLSVIEGDMTGQGGPAVNYVELKRVFGGTYIANLGYDLARANAAIAEGRADLVAMGRPFLANPDLVTRLRLGAALNEPDADTFYGGTEKGYVDYPTLSRL